MDIKEFYLSINESYEGALSVLGNDERIIKFVKKFKDDDNFNNLKACIEKDNYEEAFRYIHTLKGICFNLGFSNLARVSVFLTEALRNKTNGELKGKKDFIYKYYLDVKNVYDQIIANINLL